MADRIATETGLRTISLAQLRLSEPTSEVLEELKLAATIHGAFYLDLGGCDDLASPYTVSRGVKVATKLFSSPQEILTAFDIDTVGPFKLDGYKPLGRNAGAKTTHPDGFEAFLFSRNHLCLPEVSSAHLPLAASYPPAVSGEEEQNILTGLTNRLHHVGLSVLKAISKAFAGDLDEEVLRQLLMRHQPDHPSTSALGLLHYPILDGIASSLPPAHGLGHGAHTDVGTVTILFAGDDGLQMQSGQTPTGEPLWQNVSPKEGHAVVNIGDSARFMSSSTLQSCLHRVVPVPGQVITERYSLAYFMRPHYEAVLHDEEGKKWTSLDWHKEKYRVFRASPTVQMESASVLTGRQGYAGFLDEVV